MVPSSLLTFIPSSPLAGVPAVAGLTAVASVLAVGGVFSVAHFINLFQLFR